MRTIVIEITEFDKSDDTKGTRVIYGFGQNHLDDPVHTIQAFTDNPTSFRDGEYRVILTEVQNDRLLKYLKAGKYRCDNFLLLEEPKYMLAFSYGENPDVNMQLATIVEQVTQRYQSLRIYVQWEIANILYERNPRYRDIIHRIDLDYDRDYIRTDEVVDKFKRKIGLEAETATLFVVSQAWHAPRCIKTCKDKGFKVVGGEFVDDFSPSDPQKWVRNWLAWVLKEGTKE